MMTPKEALETMGDTTIHHIDEVGNITHHKVSDSDQYKVVLNALTELEELKRDVKRYKIGDTFNADGNTWTITEIDGEGVSLEWGKYLINVNPSDAVFVYQKLKNGRTMGIRWCFSFDEIKMINQIVEGMYETHTPQ